MKTKLTTALTIISLAMLTACSGFQAVTGYIAPVLTVQPTQPGVSCDVYSIPDGTYIAPQGYYTVVNWDTMLAAGTYQFNTTLANFDTPNESDTTLFQSFTPAEQAQIGVTNFALDCQGYLNIPETGEYYLTLGSDDGSELLIDNAIVINMPQAQAFASQTAAINLTAGLHKINVLYFQGPATNQGLELSWEGPSNQDLGLITTIPASAFSHSGAE